MGIYISPCMCSRISFLEWAKRWGFQMKRFQFHLKKKKSFSSLYFIWLIVNWCIIFNFIVKREGIMHYEWKVFDNFSCHHTFFFHHSSSLCKWDRLRLRSVIFSPHVSFTLCCLHLNLEFYVSESVRWIAGDFLNLTTDVFHFISTSDFCGINVDMYLITATYFHDLPYNKTISCAEWESWYISSYSDL